MDLKKQIKEFIADGKTEKALTLLLEYAEKENPSIHDEALLLSGQFSQWKREVTLGVQESNTELTRINIGIVDMLSLEDSKVEAAAEASKSIKPTGTEKKRNVLPMILGLIGILAVCGTIWFVFGNDAEQQTASNPTKPEVTKTEKKVNDTSNNSIPKKNSSGGTPIANSTLNGQTVNFVLAGSKKDPSSFFRYIGNSTWIEGDGAFKRKATFLEKERAETSIRLFDDSRDIFLHIDLIENKIFISETNTKERHLYDIPLVMAKVDGYYLKEVVCKDRAIFKREEEVKEWVEVDPANSEIKARFKELSRHVGYVRLQNKENNQILVLEIDEMKVFTLNKNEEESVLYNINEVF